MVPASAAGNVSVAHLKCARPSSADVLSACAAMDQVDEAKRANDISEQALLWNKFGGLGLLITIGLSIIATRAAIQSAKTSEKALREVERAAVYVEQLEHHTVLNSNGRVSHWEFWIPWSNKGRTAALNTIIYTGIDSRVFDEFPVPSDKFKSPVEKWYNFEGPEVELSRGYIGPEETRKSGPIVLHVDHLMHIFAKTGYAFIYGWVKYDDIFGGKHETRFCLRIAEIRADPSGKSSGEGVVFSHWSSHNCIDGQCAIEDKSAFAAMPQDIKDEWMAAGWKPKALNPR